MQLRDPMCLSCGLTTGGDCGGHGIQVSYTPNPDLSYTPGFLPHTVVAGSEEVYVPLSTLLAKVNAAMLLAGIDAVKRVKVEKLLLDSLGDEDE